MLSIVKTDTGAWGGGVIDYCRRHGPFEPHRLPLDEMEYTTMPAVAVRLADRRELIGAAKAASQPFLAVGAGHVAS